MCNKIYQYTFIFMSNIADKLKTTLGRKEKKTKYIEAFLK